MATIPLEDAPLAWQLRLKEAREDCAVLNKPKIEQAHAEAMAQITPKLRALAQKGKVIYIQSGMETYAYELGYKQISASAYFLERSADLYQVTTTTTEEGWIIDKTKESISYEIQFTESPKEYKLIYYVKAIRPEYEQRIRQLERQLFAEKEFMKIKQTGPVSPVPPDETNKPKPFPYVLQNVMGLLLFALMLLTNIFSCARFDVIHSRNPVVGFHWDGYLFFLLFEREGISFVEDNQFLATIFIIAMLVIAIIGACSKTKKWSGSFNFAFGSYVVYAICHLITFFIYLASENTYWDENIFLLPVNIVRMAVYVCFIIGIIMGIKEIVNQENYQHAVFQANVARSDWEKKYKFSKSPKFAQLEQLYAELRALSKGEIYIGSGGTKVQ